jgi:hypothetical protein
MKHLLFLFCWLLSLTAVYAQRELILTKPFSVAGKDTISTDSVQQLPYVEWDKPFVPKEPNRTGSLLIHVLDIGNHPYSGYIFKLEQKDFNTGKWVTYRDYQGTVEYNGGSARVKILFSQLPGGYYRIWSQCLISKTIGTELFILDFTEEDDDQHPVQVSLHIPQRQYWLPGYISEAARK